MITTGYPWYTVHAPSWEFMAALVIHFAPEVASTLDEHWQVWETGQWGFSDLNLPSFIFPILDFYRHKSKKEHQLQLLGLTLISWYTLSRLWMKLCQNKKTLQMLPLRELCPSCLEPCFCFFVPTVIHPDLASVPTEWCTIHLDTKCQEYLLLTNSEFPFSKENVHAVNVSHQFWVPKGEINHISLSCSSCQYLY